MNFDLDADDLELQAAIHDVCARTFPLDRVRATTAPDRTAWRVLGDAGVFSLTLPEERGGAGLGMRHAVLVFEELGRALVPGPLVASFLAAGLTDGAADGSTIVGLIEQGDGIVEHLEWADELLLLEAGGVFVVDPGKIRARPVERSLDPLTSFYALDGAATGRAIPADAPLLWLRGAALTAALALGIASATTEAATAYAKVREQFGRAIGSFQAVKHLLADMLVRAEVARAAVYAAGCVLDDPGGGDAEPAVATAKLLASEAALVNGKASIQVHGGMGFTWEVDAHLYAKRAAVLATGFGDASTHATIMAATLKGSR